jgi:hypothetical protein
MKWYRDMVSTVTKPTANTRQNPTVKRNVPVEWVPTKSKNNKQVVGTNPKEENMK